MIHRRLRAWRFVASWVLEGTSFLLWFDAIFFSFLIYVIDSKLIQRLTGPTMDGAAVGSFPLSDSRVVLSVMEGCMRVVRGN